MTKKERQANKRKEELAAIIKHAIREYLEIDSTFMALSGAIDDDTDYSVIITHYKDDSWTCGTMEYFYNENRESIPSRFWFQGIRSKSKALELEYEEQKKLLKDRRGY